jgi:peptide-methionine (S)-S-oxide reductase
MNIIKYMIFLACLVTMPALTYSTQSNVAVFAGGCFWTMQSDFDNVPGVLKTTAGYTGGNIPNPSYEQVENGDTGHYESVQVVFDPAKTSYQQLLDVYWHNTDPDNGDGQFCDTGSQYRPVIFYINEKQKEMAESSKQALIKSGRFPQVMTQILPASAFYPAEAYHQEFYRTHSVQYQLYKTGCGRDRELQKIWGTQ